MTAWLFPGQGSQYVGMGASWLARHDEAKRALKEASEALGFDVTRLVLEGPERDLADTFNQQPAVLAVSVAILRSARATLPQPRFVAGHSLGEYSALVAADALPYADAVRLVRERGRLMRWAGELEPGGMAAVLGLSDAEAERVCAEIEGIQVANYNAPGQVVISGRADGVDAGAAALAAAGAKRVVRLPITIAAHSRLMEPASGPFRDAVHGAPLRPARVPILANVTAEPIESVQAVQDELARQLTASVRWSDCVRRMLREGVRDFFEVGPGTVLTGLVRRIAKSEGVEDATVVALDVAGVAS